MYKKRTLKQAVLKASKTFKVIMLCGARQIGKTTFLSNIAEKNRTYISFDDDRNLSSAKKDPFLFLERNKPPILIDEVQYAPELFRNIKLIVDKSDKKGLIWLTGSQQFVLMKNVSESLAGRVAIFDMLGLSIYELDGLGLKQKPFLPSNKYSSILKRKDLNETYKIIWRGFYPEIALNENISWQQFYSSYIRTYLERDVNSLTNVVNRMDFYTFIKAVAARTAQILDLADIAKDVGISPNTAKQWLSVLQASGIVYLLQPYFSNVTKRIVKKPKIYFTDTGLCSYLTQWDTPQVLETGAMSVAIFETFVIMEILKSYWHNCKYPSFYYCRDSNGKEIDLLIYQNGTFYPIEIKKSANPNTTDVANFSLIEELKQKRGEGVLICLTDKPRPLTKNDWSISIWDI